MKFIEVTTTLENTKKFIQLDTDCKITYITGTSESTKICTETDTHYTNEDIDDFMKSLKYL